MVDAITEGPLQQTPLHRIRVLELIHHQVFGIYNVQAIKPTGAGDAFNGGFLSSLYQDFSLEDSVKRGSANAAIVVTKVGCSSAMPTLEELNQFIKNKEEI